MIGQKRAGFLGNGCCSSSTAVAADRVQTGSSIGGLGHDGSLHGEAPLDLRQHAVVVSSMLGKN